MPKSELKAYYKHVDDLVILHDNIFTQRDEGRFEGHAEGLEEGRAIGIEEGRAEGEKSKQVEIAKKMKALGMADDVIKKVTGLLPDDCQ